MGWMLWLAALTWVLARRVELGPAWCLLAAPYAGLHPMWVAGGLLAMGGVGRGEAPRRWARLSLAVGLGLCLRLLVPWTGEGVVLGVGAALGAGLGVWAARSHPPGREGWHRDVPIRAPAAGVTPHPAGGR